MILEMKSIYSIFVSEHIKEEDRRNYYFNLLNSIPDDLFNTKNPIRLRNSGTRLSCFLFSLNKELKLEKIDLSSLEQELTNMNKRFKTAISGGIL